MTFLTQNDFSPLIIAFNQSFEITQAVTSLKMKNAFSMKDPATLIPNVFLIWLVYQIVVGIPFQIAFLAHAVHNADHCRNSY